VQAKSSMETMKRRIVDDVGMDQGNQTEGKRQAEDAAFSCRKRMLHQLRMSVDD